MNWRTFLKLIGAAIVVPSLPIPKMAVDVCREPSKFILCGKTLLYKMAYGGTLINIEKECIHKHYPNFNFIIEGLKK